MTHDLNGRALRLLACIENPGPLRIHRHDSSAECGGIYDFGVNARGGLSAGLLLSRLCLGDLAEVSLSPTTLDLPGGTDVVVSTDQPLAACLLSQYAGWRVSVDDYFGMGSGPFRAMAAREELFNEFDYREAGDHCFGVLESDALPSPEVFGYLAERLQMPAKNLTLAVAPTASIAGTLQIAARSVETALHKLHEIGFDVQRVVSGYGAAPLPSVGHDFLAALGRTNDAILYGGRVTLWVTGDDDSLNELGPRVPSSSSSAYGQPFADIFQAAGGDFYKIDPLLFSPAQVVFQNIDTGKVFSFGRCAVDVLRRSFGYA